MFPLGATLVASEAGFGGGDAAAVLRRAPTASATPLLRHRIPIASSLKWHAHGHRGDAAHWHMRAEAWQLAAQIADRVSVYRTCAETTQMWWLSFVGGLIVEASSSPGRRPQ
jgi:hypothetical protein